MPGSVRPLTASRSFALREWRENKMQHNFWRWWRVAVEYLRLVRLPSCRGYSKRRLGGREAASETPRAASSLRGGA